MRVKGDNLKLISGLLLSSFILNFMLIRVKKRVWNKKNRKNREREKRTIKRKKKAKTLRNSLLDHNSSVEVGYDFYAIS